MVHADAPSHPRQEASSVAIVGQWNPPVRVHPSVELPLTTLHMRISAEWGLFFEHHP